MKRVHLFISGRVQGVFFRAFTVEKAKELGVVGFVRNLSDGRVEVVAEGEKEKLKEFINYLWSGPEAAYVESMDIKWEKATKEFKSFEKLPTI